MKQLFSGLLPVCASSVFLRSGEVVTPSEAEFDQSTHLSLTDVKVDSHFKPSRLEIRIKAS